jgi:hypothetical protein
VKEVDKMDKGKVRWDWLPAHMPGVARLLAERRAAVGAEWVNECWRRGVVEGQPGWFFAAEGPLAVGMPWGDDPQIQQCLVARITPTQALLVLRPKEAAHGAH